jgi:hypothetical protein
VGGFNYLADAISSTGGATIAILVIKNMPGTPLVKSAIGVSVIIVIQVSTLVVTKALNIINKLDTNNFIGNIFSNKTNLKVKYPDYTLNLLPEMSQLVDA